MNHSTILPVFLIPLIPTTSLVHNLPRTASMAILGSLYLSIKNSSHFLTLLLLLLSLHFSDSFTTHTSLTSIHLKHSALSLSPSLPRNSPSPALFPLFNATNSSSSHTTNSHTPLPTFILPILLENQNQNPFVDTCGQTSQIDNLNLNYETHKYRIVLPKFPEILTSPMNNGCPTTIEILGPISPLISFNPTLNSSLCHFSSHQFHTLT